MHPWISAVLKTLEQRRPPLFCVHYACDSLVSARNQTSMVSAIAVRILGMDQTKVFSLGLMAEREGLAPADIAQQRTSLEKSLFGRVQLLPGADELQVSRCLVVPLGHARCHVWLADAGAPGADIAESTAPH